MHPTRLRAREVSAFAEDFEPLPIEWVNTHDFPDPVVDLAEQVLLAAGIRLLLVDGRH